MKPFLQRLAKQLAANKKFKVINAVMLYEDLPDACLPASVFVYLSAYAYILISGLSISLSISLIVSVLVFIFVRLLVYLPVCLFVRLLARFVAILSATLLVPLCRCVFLFSFAPFVCVHVCFSPRPPFSFCLPVCSSV